jgi:hypothetical protein
MSYDLFLMKCSFCSGPHQAVYLGETEEGYSQRGIGKHRDSVTP